jgi:hypothetical protein
MSKSITSFYNLVCNPVYTRKTFQGTVGRILRFSGLMKLVPCKNLPHDLDHLSGYVNKISALKGKSH